MGGGGKPLGTRFFPALIRPASAEDQVLLGAVRGKTNVPLTFPKRNACSLRSYSASQGPTGQALKSCVAHSRVVIVQATGAFCDSGLREEAKAFFTAHPAAERSLKQSMERMNYCVDLKTQQGTSLPHG